MYYIDKTECLEKGIAVFPSIYIMGASATGKSTLVDMFLKKHPEVKSLTIDMEKVLRCSETEHIRDETEQMSLKCSETEHFEQQMYCIVLENIPAKSQVYSDIARFIEEMPGHMRVILVGRNTLPDTLLPLLWKRRLDIISREMFSFTRDDVRTLGSYWKSPLNPDEVWQFTGGWAGCVDLMMRASVNFTLHQDTKALEIMPEDLLESYEIKSYIENHILNILSNEERLVLDLAISCPWMNLALAREMILIDNLEFILESLTRKGFLVFNRNTGRWKKSPLFAGCTVKNTPDYGKLGAWYESENHLREALVCYEKTTDTLIYNKFVKQYYNLIPFGYRFFMKGKWNGENAESIYLRGMQCYMRQDFSGLDREIRNLTELDVEDVFLKKEILLNLYYTKPSVSLDEWLEMLESAVKEFENTGRKFRLYNTLGYSCTYLCGIRDLTGLFACSKKEENRRAKLWKKAFREREWIRYQLARIDYYLETERQDVIREEAQLVLGYESVNPLAKLYLLGKLDRIFKDNEFSEWFQRESNEMLRTDDFDDARIAEAYISIHAPWMNEPDRLTRWLKNSENETRKEINEQNYCILWFMAKGYLMLGQYKKAEKILRRLIPYIKKYRRQKLLTEALFQQAIISMETGSRSRALTYAIESFYISGSARYVRFYVSYGKRAKEVLEIYEEWYQKTEPEGWSHKKKYQYGNVLRMPMADYLDVIMRGIRKETRSKLLFQTQPEEVANEHLTMMETVILQELGRGLTNNEICKEQNLKLPTVKSHIYSLYKKLGVNSRVQATIKGKEMGILE